MKDTWNYTTCHCHHWPCAYFYLLKSLGVIVAFFISLRKNSLNIRGAEHVCFIEATLWLQRRKREQYQDNYDQWKGITPSFLKLHHEINQKKSSAAFAVRRLQF